MKKEIISPSPAKTREVGEKFAGAISKLKKVEKAKVISLEGELGSGKTTFLKGVAKGLGIKEMIKSPTFVIIKKYKLTTNNKRQTTKGRKSKVVSHELKGHFYHIDCYRIENPKEILGLGWEEILEKPQNIIAVEWGEKIREVFPKKYSRVKFRFINRNIRKITFFGRGF